MAVTAKWFGQALVKALNKEIDIDSDTLKVALLANTYTPNQDTHDYWDDVSANEVAGTGYTAGGVALANAAVTYDGGTNIVKIDADDASWANSTITARYAVIYDDTPATAATKPLLGYVDFGVDESSVDGTFLITWSADGILRVTVS